MLEEYVQYQIDNRVYDFDANMALLKMYQFDPSNFQGDKVADILLLALTNLPKSDFLLCKYLLDTQKVMIWNSFFFGSLSSIQSIVSIQCQENARIVEALHFSELLESCRFQEFWVMKKSFRCILNCNIFYLGRFKTCCGEYSRFSRSYSRLSVAPFFPSPILFDCL